MKLESRCQDAGAQNLAAAFCERRIEGSAHSFLVCLFFVLQTIDRWQKTDIQRQKGSLMPFAVIDADRFVATFSK